MIFLLFYGESDIGNVRQENQDCFSITQLSDSVLLAAVYDGMGGLSSGAHASSSARDCFVKYVTKNLEKYKKASGKIVLNDDTVVKNILSEAIARTNHMLYMETISSTRSEMMGTTIACVLIIGKKTYVCHVGDSRVYALASGRIVRLTEDHSLVQYLVDTSMISRAEASKHPDKNVLTRAIGTDETVSPDISVTVPPKTKYYLICSDGLTLHVSDAEMEAVLTRDTDAKEKVESLISLAKSRGGRDNVTAIVIGPLL